MLTIVTDSKLQSNMKRWVVKGQWTLQRCHLGLAALESACGSQNSAATWVLHWWRRPTGHLWRSCWRWAVNCYWSRNCWKWGGYCVWSCSLWICVSCLGMETNFILENMQIVTLSLCVLSFQCQFICWWHKQAGCMWRSCWKWYSCHVFLNVSSMQWLEFYLWLTSCLLSVTLASVLVKF